MTFGTLIMPFLRSQEGSGAWWLVFPTLLSSQLLLSGIQVLNEIFKSEESTSSALYLMFLRDKKMSQTEQTHFCKIKKMKHLLVFRLFVSPHLVLSLLLVRTNTT